MSVVVDEELPERIGDVMIGRRLGAGGMAEVFLGQGDAYPGQVVVKRILPNLAADDLYVDMFRREAEVALSIEHEHIVKTFGVSPEGPGVRPYIVMEYVPGLTLKELLQRQWLQSEPLPLDELACVISDASVALDFVHHAETSAGIGIVHRDVSPENLMVGPDGKTKVLDFGIARPEQVAALTRTGDLKGKIPYMSPEQASGGVVTGASDCYALGITLYWALCQKRPFDRISELKTLNAIVDDVPTAPSPYIQDIPPDVVELMAHLLQKHPENRPRRARDIAASLQTFATPAARERLADRVQSLTSVTLASLKEDFFDRAAGLPTQVDRAGAREAHAELWDALFANAAVAGGGTAPTISARGARRPEPSWTPAFVRAGGAAALLLVMLTGALLLRPPAQAAEASMVQRFDRSTRPLLELAASDVEASGAADDAQDARSRSGGAGAAKPPAGGADARAGASGAAPSSQKKQSLTIVGPRELQWRLLDGTPVTVRRGRALVEEVPKTLVVVDGRLGSRHRVPVVNGKADFEQLNRGQLTVRAVPFATVFLGARKLGETPLNDVSLVEGGYTVRLEHEGRSIEKKAQISPGAAVRIGVNFNRE